jgi:hypothetical protein
LCAIVARRAPEFGRVAGAVTTVADIDSSTATYGADTGGEQRRAVLRHLVAGTVNGT